MALGGCGGKTKLLVEAAELVWAQLEPFTNGKARSKNTVFADFAFTDNSKHCGKDHDHLFETCITLTAEAVPYLHDEHEGRQQQQQQHLGYGDLPPADKGLAHGTRQLFEDAFNKSCTLVVRSAYKQERKTQLLKPPGQPWTSAACACSR